MTVTAGRALVSFYILLLGIVAYLAIGWPHDDGMGISREEFGSAWPLTVPKGTLRCELGQEITFHSNGTTYSVNRSVKHSGYADIGSLLAEDAGGGKMDLGPLIERATDLCR